MAIPVTDENNKGQETLMKWFKQIRQIQVQEVPTAEFWSAVLQLRNTCCCQECQRFQATPDGYRPPEITDSLQVIEEWLDVAFEAGWLQAPDLEID